MRVKVFFFVIICRRKVSVKYVSSAASCRTTKTLMEGPARWEVMEAEDFELQRHRTKCMAAVAEHHPWYVKARHPAQMPKLCFSVTSPHHFMCFFPFIENNASFLILQTWHGYSDLVCVPDLLSVCSFHTCFHKFNCTIRTRTNEWACEKRPMPV